MISTEKNFLFIHVPKTGGNSIQNVLIDYSDDRKINNINKPNAEEHFGLNIAGYPDLHKHSTLEDYFFQLDRELYESLFKFSVIRNPWEWCISWYFHRNKQEWDKEKFGVFVKKIPTFTDYLTIFNKRSILVNKLIKKTPGVYSIFGDKFGDELDYIIRFENLSEDFNLVAMKLGIQQLSLPHVNKSSHKPYFEYYDKKLFTLVKDKFAREIEYGSYIFSDQ